MTEYGEQHRAVAPRHGMDARRDLIPFRSLLDRSSDAFVGYDFTGRRVYSNPVYEKLIGRSTAPDIGQWGPFPDWAPGTAKTISTGMRRARELSQRGQQPTEAVMTKLSHPSGQFFDVSMQFEVYGRGEAAIGLALVQPLHRLPWLERRTGRDADQLQALEDVVRSIALELTRVGVAPVSNSGAASGPKVAPPSELTALSGREWKILQEILAGRRVPTIATSLSLSQHTVRNHLKAIFRKLGVHSQAELVERYRAIQGHGQPQSHVAGPPVVAGPAPVANEA